METMQKVGFAIAVVGILWAMVTGFLPDVSVSGGTGGGGPSGDVGVSFGSPWVGVAIAALGVGLSIAGRPPVGAGGSGDAGEGTDR